MDGKATIELFGYLAITGVCVAFAWLVFLSLVSVGCRVWDWIDDREVPTLNPVVKFLMVNVFGCDCQPGRIYFVYIKDYYKSCGDRAVFYPALALALSPFAVHFYEISLFLVSLACIALLARFARRAKKGIDSHVKDKDAHK